MNEQLHRQCGDKIEVLYQRRRMVSAEAAWQRLREELTLISGTKAEQQFLIAAEIAKHCRRHSWPVWEAGVGANSIILFLLELSLADPVENDLPFQRFFFSDKGETVDLLLKTLDQYVEPLGQVLTATGADGWARIGTTTRRRSDPDHPTGCARRRGSNVARSRWASGPLSRCSPHLAGRTRGGRRGGCRGYRRRDTRVSAWPARRVLSGRRWIVLCSVADGRCAQVARSSIRSGAGLSRPSQERRGRHHRRGEGWFSGMGVQHHRYVSWRRRFYGTS